MAENVPPATNGASTDAPGLPYYEKLKRDIRQTIVRKRSIDKKLVRCNAPVYTELGANKCQ